MNRDSSGTVPPILVARFPKNRNCEPRFLRNRATSRPYLWSEALPAVVLVDVLAGVGALTVVLLAQLPDRLLQLDALPLQLLLLDLFKKPNSVI